jgi:tetratricopeptide (TPR) repeat protein
MPKSARNDPCPCGSGLKYKRCCLDKDQAGAHASLAVQQAERAARQAQRRAEIADFVAAINGADELDAASNGVVDLIHAGRLDEAEQAACDLLVRYPEVPDGHDRLGMVYEARAQNHEAAQCYRRVVDFMRAHPGDFDPESETFFLERIAKLDPTAPTG